jgi:hypothetical protein
MKCSGLLDKDFEDNEKRERAIARRLGLQGEAFTFTKQRLVASNLIDDEWQPRSWQKLQFKSDHDAAERQRRSRAKKRVTSLSRDSHTLEQNRTDTEQKKDISTAAQSRVPSRHVDLVFEHWQKTFGHTDAKLTPKRRRLIAARLKDFPVERLTDALDGYKRSPFHMGDNERQTVYDSIELFLRDAEHVEKGLALISRQNVQPLRPYL